MIFGLLLGAVLGAVLANAPANDLWFFADFDHVPRMAGRAFRQTLPEGGDVAGRFGKGYAFVSDEERCESRFWVVRDKELLRSFPRERGTFSCWFRSPEKYLAATDSPAFGYCGFWKSQWTWRGASFSTGSTATIKDFVRSSDWRHFAATWNDVRLVLYLDGQAVAETPNPKRIDMSDVSKCALRIGTGFDGSPAANLEMDEIAIFSRDLSAEEVGALAGAEKGMLDGCFSVVADYSDFPFFWRNQANAVLRFHIQASEQMDVELSGEIAGESIAVQTVRLDSSMTRLAVPFDPSRLKPGKYPWKIRLTLANGTKVWCGSGEFEIRPRLERDAFKMLNWGGWKNVSDDYLKAVGINSTMANAFKVDQVRRQVEAGFFPNLRYENVKQYKLSFADFDAAKIREQTRRDFASYEGLHAWVSTLVNSEIYGTAVAQRSADSPAYDAWAKRALGGEPDFRFRNAPIELDSKTAGEWPTGVVHRGSCRQLDTLRWVMARGMPQYCFSRLAADAIHVLDADNTVWSEPAFDGVVANLDMLADWHYQYRTDATVRELKSYYAYCRPYGKPYMPTLSAGYYHGDVRPSLVPVEGRKKKIAAQSADEVAIKAWLSLAAVPAHALSFFALDVWSEGEKLGIAEPGTGARFGKTWREQIAPAADLLRDLPNERAPVALVRPSECGFTCGLGWGQVHYPNCIAAALVKMGVPYDVLRDREIESGALKDYQYAILPMAKTIYADHVTNIEEAVGAGCCVVTDSYAARRFEKGVHLDNLKHPHDYRKNRHLIDAALQPWADAVLPGLREKLTAWSEGDGDTSYTFVKVADGVKYVTVVNDRRSDEQGFLNGCVTNGWYHPYGASQTIATHFNVPAESSVYLFNANGDASVRLKERAVALPYGAAQAKVFCIYPKPLARLRMDVKDDSVRIALVDADGKLAPGRQVVEVEVRDPDGTLHDETGRYVMERGHVKIPLRLAKDDLDGTADKGWRIRAKELTTGFSASVTWWRGKRK